MSAVSPIFAGACLILALSTAWLLTRFHAEPKRSDRRVSSIDCLRGYLALFVYFHHCSVWYFYLRTNHWELPPSTLYTHLGQSSVGLFFMITGFLFFSKLLDARQRPVEWRDLFVSRLARLLPLYLFVMAQLFLIVAIQSRGVLQTSLLDLLISCARWLSFTILGAPDINGVANTAVITSGVSWSLTYEWLFYLSLPAIAALLSVPVPLKYLAYSLLAIAGAVVLHISLLPIAAFAAGIASAIFARARFAPRVAVSRVASCVALGFVFVTFFVFPGAYTPIPLILLSIAFAVISCGNRLFGVLDSVTCRMLGDTSYSIYLLHGMILFCTFTYVVGSARAASLTTIQHWCVCALCTPVLVLCSFITYRVVELPAMSRVRLALRHTRDGSLRRSA